MIPLIIEHLFRAGQLTLPANVQLRDAFLVDERKKVNEAGTEIIISKWLFNQPQMSIADLQALENSAPFQTFLTTRETILAREQSKKLADEDFRIGYKILLNEFNILRDFDRKLKTEIAAATSLANLQTRIATLPNLPDRTLTQFKNAMDNET